jgi:Holliday junction resolvasome RuvABC endonuclease subunit
MSSTSSKEKRVLAIDPTTKGFGFAVMEGPEKLIDWGVKGVKGSKNQKSLELVSALIDHYQPDVIVVEDYSGKGSRRCKRIQELITRIIKLGSEKNVRIRNVSPFSVRRAFSESGDFTKHQIATAIAQRLPELASRLPPYRKCWMSEDYRMSIFDAVSFALTFFHLEK